MAPQQAALGAGAACMGAALVAENTRLFAPIGQGMLSVGILVANSPAYDWEAVFVVSKAILVQAGR